MHLIGGIKERILIDRLKKGDQTAFELLFHFYYPGLVVYAKKFTLDHMQAEEAVQDFFVRLWEKHTSLKSNDSLKSYFFTSIKNKSLNILKHNKVRERHIQELKELSSDNMLYDPDLYINSELQDKIQKSIEQLPTRCKEIFILSRLKNLSNEEIADQLGISKRTVETQISKALKFLRNELKDYVGLLFLLSIVSY